MLYIIGLGPGDPDLVTKRALEACKSVKKVLLRTGQIKCARWLKERLRGKEAELETLDRFYESAEDFDDLCSLLADRVIECAQVADTVYAVTDVAEASVTVLLRKLADLGKYAPAYCVIPGVPAFGSALAGLSGEYQIADASCWETVHFNPRIPLVIRELDDRLLAGECKLKLMEKYPADTPVVFYPSTVSGRETAPVYTTLEELDRQSGYDHTVCVRIDPVTLDDLSRRVMSQDEDVRFDFAHLCEIMRKLRAPGGCPWDREQTHASLKRNLIEECYEALECIDEDDPYRLYDELGDVLMQVVLHAQIGDEYGEFNIDDVTQAICKKMIFRHSHIFGSDKVKNADEVVRLWEERKKQEKNLNSVSDAITGVSRTLPALMRASKVQQKAANVGFDWDNPYDALDKVAEETGEVMQALKDSSNVEEELGDLLFAAVNTARLAGFDAEQALTAATDKFARRFSAMEKAIRADGLELKGMSLRQMDEYWNRIKHNSEE